MALDLMEAVRPEVDAFVLDLLEGHIFRARDFRETRDGNCRILAPLTHALTQTAPRWRRAVAPVAERVARMLLNGEQATKLLPTHLTGDNRSRARELHRKGSRKVPRQTRPRLPRACAVCGQLLDRRASDRILCADCLTERRIEAGVRIATAGPAALAKLRLEGLDPAHGGPAKAKRVAALARNQARIRAFEEASTVGSDAEVFRREILPGIKDLGLGELVRATGLTAGYLSRVRRGLVVPHSMHWPALAAAAAEASREPEV